MFPLIEDDDLLENLILFEIKSRLIQKKEFDSKPVCNKKVLKNQNKISW